MTQHPSFILKNGTKDQFSIFIKSASFIKKLLNKIFYLLLYKKTVWEILTIFADCFYYISQINVTYIFADAYNIKLSDYNTILDYKNCY